MPPPGGPANRGGSTSRFMQIILGKVHKSVEVMLTDEEFYTYKNRNMIMGTAENLNFLIRI